MREKLASAIAYTVTLAGMGVMGTGFYLYQSATQTPATTADIQTAQAITEHIEHTTKFWMTAKSGTGDDYQSLPASSPLFKGMPSAIPATSNDVKVDPALNAAVAEMYYQALFKESSSSSKTSKNKHKKSKKSKSILVAGSNETMFNNSQIEPAVRDFPNQTNFLDPTTLLMNSNK